MGNRVVVILAKEYYISFFTLSKEFLVGSAPTVFIKENIGFLTVEVLVSLCERA